MEATGSSLSPKHRCVQPNAGAQARPSEQSERGNRAAAKWRLGGRTAAPCWAAHAQQRCLLRRHNPNAWFWLPDVPFFPRKQKSQEDGTLSSHRKPVRSWIVLPRDDFRIPPCAGRPSRNELPNQDTSHKQRDQVVGDTAHMCAAQRPALTRG